MKVLGLSLLGVILGIAVLWWHTQDSNAQARSTRPSEPALPSSPVERTARSTTPVVDRAPELPSPAEVRPEPTVADQRATLQSRFAAQQIDPAWASTARAELRDDLGRLASSDVRVQNIECRASLCRLELQLANRDSGTAFMQSWLRQRTWTGPGFAVTDDDTGGAATMIVYLGKPGTELPRE